jgi:pimeloyl-ACP methyl ester carboxylesterase
VERTFVSAPSPVTPRNGAGFLPCQGLWHAPAQRTPRVAFIATHYNVDFSEHYLGPLLAERGFGFLGWNTKYRGNEPFFLLEQALVEIGVGVRWLRETAGVETVVLLGNSGGGSLMAAYQSQATGVTIEPAPDLALPEALGDLPPGDLYVSLNAHGGRPEVMTAWMDASVVDETDPFAVDPDLDPFARERPYDPAFVERYRAAQVARNERITDWVLEELGRVKAAGHSDRAFLIHRIWADLRFMDPTLDASARTPERCYAGDPRRANFGPFNIGKTCTLRSWLSMWSLRHSPCRGAAHLGRIRVPSLVIQSDADAGVFPSDARAIHDALGAEDRTLVTIPGDHYLTSPEGAREDAAERIADWARARAGAP